MAGDRDGLPDLKDIRGQEEARLALEVAAAGGHNLLMSAARGGQVYAGVALARHFATA